MQRIEDLEGIFQLQDNSKFIAIHKIDKIRSIFEEINIPPKVDTIQMQLHEDKERGFKVTNFLYDLIVNLQTTGSNSIFFSD